MINRLIQLPKTQSFFLFGPRGAGKSTLLKSHFQDVKTLWLDLLNPAEEDRYSLEPDLLLRQLEIGARPAWVVIDEIQKVPRLLNVVHKLIEDKKLKFALTGSSSRRLKQKGVNLLAGRAVNRSLYPFSHEEVGWDYPLQSLLNWGALPKLWELSENADKKDFLQAYGLNYLKNEIQQEQWVRRLDPFRKFLPIAAQMNGKPLNYSSIARDVGVEVTTVQNYFEILEDTLLGFHVYAFHQSIRKQQRQAPKFYFFDTGVRRALERRLDVEIQPGTYEFGNSFEHWVILEIYKQIQMKNKDFELFYLRTKDGVEIDLIVDRPARRPALVEIKSTNAIRREHISSFIEISRDFRKADSYVLSLDPRAQKIEHVACLPWQAGVREIFR